MDEVPEYEEISDEEKIGITVKKLWKVFDYMVDEYSINEEDFASALNEFKKQVCAHFNQESYEDIDTDDEGDIPV